MILHSQPFILYAHSLPGFSRLRMHSKYSPAPGSVPVAFVEFIDAGCAASAMALLQGTFLLSSDRGAIRIEFAKSRMAAEMHHIMGTKEVCNINIYIFFRIFVFFLFFPKIIFRDL